MTLTNYSDGLLYRVMVIKGCNRLLDVFTWCVRHRAGFGRATWRCTGSRPGAFHFHLAPVPEAAHRLALITCSSVTRPCHATTTPHPCLAPRTPALPQVNHSADKFRATSNAPGYLGFNLVWSVVCSWLIWHVIHNLLLQSMYTAFCYWYQSL